MKRIFSIALISVLLVTVGGTAMADQQFAEIGKEMQNQANNIFSHYLLLYPDGKGAPDEIIDRMYEFQLFFLVGRIMYQMEMNHDGTYSMLFGKDQANEIVRGWEMAIEALTGIHKRYMDGEASKDEYAKCVFDLAKAAFLGK